MHLHRPPGRCRRMRQAVRCKSCGAVFYKGDLTVMVTPENGRDLRQGFPLPSFTRHFVVALHSQSQAHAWGRPQPPSDVNISIPLHLIRLLNVYKRLVFDSRVDNYFSFRNSVF